MDASAFEASGNGDPEPPLREVIDLMDDDLKYAIAGAIAVVKHVLNLVVLIVALATCVAIYCFLLCWLCQLWLQTRLFLFTSAMLRQCMDEPRRVQSLNIGDVHKPEASTIQDREKQAETASSPEKVQENQNETHGFSDNVQGTVNRVSQAVISNSSKIGLPHAKKTRPQFPESWLPAAVENESQTFPSQRNVDQEALLAAGPAVDKHENGEQVNARYETHGEDHARHIRQRPTWTGQEHQHQRPTKSDAPKLSSEEQKAQDQRAWLDQLTSSPPPSRRSSGPSQGRQRAPTISPRKARNDFANGNPFGFTAEQLAEAAGFAAEATRGGQKKNSSASNRLPNVSFRAHKPSTPSRPVRRAEPVMMHTGNVTTSNGPDRAGQSSGGIASTPRPGTGSMAPHLRKAMEAKAGRAASEGSPVSGQQEASMDAESSNATAMSPEIQDQTPTEEFGSRSQSVTAKQEEQHMDMPLPSASEAPIRPENLHFYDGTPELKNPAPRAMSAALLKTWGATLPSEVEVQRARLYDNDADFVMTKRVPQSQQHPKNVHSTPVLGKSDTRENVRPSSVTPMQEKSTTVDPFTTPSKEQIHPSVSSPVGKEQSEQGQADLQEDEPNSTQQEFPSAAEFEAAFFASQHKEDVKEPERTTTPLGKEQSITGEADKTSARKASIAKQAVRVLQERAHAKNASTSTYTTALEGATPTHQPSHQADKLNLTDETDEKTPSKVDDAQTPGGKSSKLVPNAPAFFAPTQASTRSASISEPSNASRTPLFVPGDATATSSATPFQAYGSTASTFAPNAFMTAVPEPQHSYMPTMLPSVPEVAAPATPHGLVSTISPFTHHTMTPTNPYASAPTLSSFGPGIAYPTTPHAAGNYYDVSPMSGSDVLPSLTGPGPFGIMGNSAMRTYGTPHTHTSSPYASNTYPMRDIGMTQSSRNASSTIPLRRPSLAVPIVRPPEPVRPFNLQDENAFPRLSSAPAPPGHESKALTPPGLGDPKPERQTVFDALLSKAESPTLATSHRQAEEPVSTKPIDNTKLKLRQMESLKAFSRNFKLPEMSDESAKQKPASVSSVRRDSPVDHDKDQGTETVAERSSPIPDDTVSRAADESNKVSSADHDDHSKQQLEATAENKRAKREMKKTAREAATEAWCNREDIRRKVVSSWSIEAAADLRDTTRAYHQRRDELAVLMANGKLNEEDAKTFPRFSDLDLSAPKHRPEGVAEVQRKRREERMASASLPTPDTAQGQHSPQNRDEGQVANAKDGPNDDALFEHLDGLKGKVRTAWALREQALDYSKQPRPQTSISYASWKKNGDAKLERAIKFYRTKREALMADCPKELQADVGAEFPII